MRTRSVSKPLWLTYQSQEHQNFWMRYFLIALPPIL